MAAPATAARSGPRLKQLDFQAGATCTYQDSTLGANVTIELLQFGSHGDAKQWLGFFSGTPSGDTKLTIPGESGSNGWSDSQPANDAYSLIGMFVSGDTFYNITVFGSQELDNNSPDQPDERRVQPAGERLRGTKKMH